MVVLSITKLLVQVLLVLLVLSSTFILTSTLFQKRLSTNTSKVLITVYWPGHALPVNII